MLRRTQINLLTLKNQKIYTDDVLIESALKIIEELENRYSGYIVRDYFIQSKRLLGGVVLTRLMAREKELREINREA